MQRVWCKAPSVDHLCGRCMDYFVVKGCGERGATDTIAFALDTVTSKNPIARNCGTMYKNPLTLPACLWEASPTNPINYCMNAVNAMPDQSTVSNILWAPSVGTLLRLPIRLFSVRAVRNATVSHEITVASRHCPLWARKMSGQPDEPSPGWHCGRLSL